MLYTSWTIARNRPWTHSKQSAVSSVCGVPANHSKAVRAGCSWWHYTDQVHYSRPFSLLYIKASRQPLQVAKLALQRLSGHSPNQA